MGKCLVKLNDHYFGPSCITTISLSLRRSVYVLIAMKHRAVLIIALVILKFDETEPYKAYKVCKAASPSIAYMSVWLNQNVYT